MLALEQQFINNREVASKAGSSNTKTTTPDSGLDNYSYFTKNNIPLLYYGPKGSTARLLSNNGKYAIVLTGTNGRTNIFTLKKPKNPLNPFSILPQPKDTTADTLPELPQKLANIKFYDAQDNYAKIYRASNGQYVIHVVRVNGTETVYTTTNVYNYDQNKSKSFLIGKSVGGLTEIEYLKKQEEKLVNEITNNSVPGSGPASGSSLYIGAVFRAV